MFDIGFWEILVIAVVALVVVGPEEFPVLVRSAGRGLGKLRGFMSSVRNDLDYEIDRANEVKRLIEEETKIAEMHNLLNENTTSVSSKSSTNKVESSNEVAKTEADQGSTQSVDDRRSDKHPS